MPIFTSAVSGSGGGADTLTIQARINVAGSMEVTGSPGTLTKAGEDVSGGGGEVGNFGTLQSNLTVEADFLKILYGPVTISASPARNITIQDTAKVKIIDFDDV
tara:strand:+ start:1084 stop:1395 length:312 start_codon:yes stop_codon:yes gene_type:complete